MTGPDVVASEPLLKVGLIGPLPPPSGGMANQTRQLARLLAEAGVSVELVQVNAPYRPEWMGEVWGLRALFRLLPYLARLWRCAGRVDLFHVMANSGWAWHLFAAPAVWLASLRGKPVIINYRGGEADSFFASQFHWVNPPWRAAWRPRGCAVIVPSGFLEAVFAKRGVKTERSPTSSISRVSGRLSPLGTVPPPSSPATSKTSTTSPRRFGRVCPDSPGLSRAARLTVAGSGPRLAGLEALCDELQIAEAVRFTGRLDNEHMADLYRDADLLLNLPGEQHANFAAGGDGQRSAYRQHRCRRNSLSGRTRRQRHAGTTGTTGGDGSRALRVLDDPALAARLRDAGLARARRYTWPLVSERLFAMYVKVLGRQIKPAGGPRPGRLPCE